VGQEPLFSRAAVWRVHSERKVRRMSVPDISMAAAAELVNTPALVPNTPALLPVRPSLAHRIVAIVPCHNEATAVAKVVRDLRASVPDIVVYVFDNCSTDGTADAARRAGAIVRTESTKGKGNVVRRAFADIDADVYVLIDGDDTYDAAMAPTLIAKLLEGPYDHVLGVRAPVVDAASAYRRGHEFGNRLLNRIVASIFGTDVGDMLSGYRVFSRRFVKSFPAVSREFEIETELTVHCLALRVPAAAVPVGFRDRPPGSESKLRTYRDGSKILRLIMSLTRHERPMAFYGTFALLSFLVSAGACLPVLLHYLHTGRVPQLPTFAVSLALVTIGVLAMLAGLILDGIRKARYEGSRLAYLTYAAVETDAVGVAVPLHAVSRPMPLRALERTQAP
jgi:hypothetical protein